MPPTPPIVDNGGNTAGPAEQRPAGLLPQTELSRLILFHGNNKDKTTPRAWAEMVDRHVTVLNWSNEQTAGAAIEAMREDANIWRQNLADHGDPDKRSVLKDWSKLKVEFLNRFEKHKTRACKVQALSTLKQHAQEACEPYYDRVCHALNTLTAKQMKTYEQGSDELKGFLECKDLFESALFMSGLRPEVRVYVEMELQDTTSSADIFTKARQTETAMASKSNKQLAAITTMEKPPDAWANYIMDQIRSTEDHQVAVVKAATKKKKPVRRARTKVLPGTGPQGGTMIPPAQRTRPILCNRCLQWGVHYSTECKISMEEVNRMTPQSRDNRPASAPYDPQYPNA